MHVQLKAAGLDMGNSLTKVVVGAAKPDTNWVEIPTTVLPDYYGREQSDESKRTFMETLDVTIASPALQTKRRWLVGEALLRDKDLGDKAIRPGKGNSKVEEEPLFVTGLVALAVAALRQGKVSSRNREILAEIDLLHAGLPYNQHTADNKKLLRKKLKGTHTLTFHALAGISGEVQVQLKIEQVKSLPEGMPAILAQAYKLGRDGHVAIVNEKLLQKPVGVLDIGGGTSDRLVFGANLDLNTSECRTMEVGINDALEKAVASLQEAGWKRTFQSTAALVARLRSGELVVEGRDGSVNVMDHLEKHLRIVGNALQSELSEAWGDNIPQFLVVGGGAHLLQEYLVLKNGVRPIVAADGEWQNALGSYIASLLMGA